MRAQLVPLEGGTPVDVAKDMTIVGRNEDCDLRLDHKSISKIHCVLVKTDGLLLVRDLGSTNGTRVNGTRVRRGMLLPNDKISFANFHYRVVFGAALRGGDGYEKTQQLDKDDLERVLAKGDSAAPMADSAEDMPVLEIQANALPDVYPEESKKKK